jgi:hypothetical protein
VINLRISGLVAFAAFFLSFIIGLISRTNFPTLILRPLIFAAVFFAISALINFLVTHFLPELLEDTLPEDDSEHLSGTRIDIMEGDSEGTQLNYSPGVIPAVPGSGFMGAQPEDSGDDVGSISSFAGLVNPVKTEDRGISEGMDHNANSGYTETVSRVDFPENNRAGKSTAESRKPDAFDDSEEILPDLDSMAGAFVSNYSQEEPDTTEYSVSTPAKKSSSRVTKGSEWAGDFNAKDIAAGLRTVLNREKEG